MVEETTLYIVLLISGLSVLRFAFKKELSASSAIFLLSITMGSLVYLFTIDNPLTIESTFVLLVILLLIIAYRAVMQTEVENFKDIH